MKVILLRVAPRRDATLGVLLVNDFPEFLTLEEPWLENAKHISCIPDGLYLCKRHSGFRFKDTFVVTNVPGRSAILFHQGNTTKDTEGCILVGNNYGRLGKLPAVLSSAAAFLRFRQIFRETDKFYLKVVTYHEHQITH